MNKQQITYKDAEAALKILSSEDFLEENVYEALGWSEEKYNYALEHLVQQKSNIKGTSVARSTLDDQLKQEIAQEINQQRGPTCSEKKGLTIENLIKSTEGVKKVWKILDNIERKNNK